MNLTEYKNRVMTALRENVDLETWCQTTYGKGVAVFIGVDEEKPPCHHTCPCVELYLPGKHTGTATPNKRYQIGAICSISDKGKVNHSDPLIDEYAGVDRLEVFREMVQEIMVSELPSTITECDLIVENVPVSAFPMFQADMSFIAEETQVLGAGVDPFE